MERIWAPWRTEYISTLGRQNGCIFCDLPCLDNDKENLILLRDRHSFIIMNKFPYAAGHLMVAPYRHTDDLNDLSDDEQSDISKNIRKCVNALKRCMSPQGFNIGANLGGAAGAGVINHIHYHIVPRWNGDSNFMPAIGNTRVISEGIEQTFDRLFPILSEL